MLVYDWMLGHINDSNQPEENSVVDIGQGLRDLIEKEKENQKKDTIDYKFMDLRDIDSSFDMSKVHYIHPNSPEAWREDLQKYYNETSKKFGYGLVTQEQMVANSKTWFRPSEVPVPQNIMNQWVAQAQNYCDMRGPCNDYRQVQYFYKPWQRRCGERIEEVVNNPVEMAKPRFWSPAEQQRYDKVTGMNIDEEDLYAKKEKECRMDYEQSKIHNNTLDNVPVPPAERVGKLPGDMTMIEKSKKLNGSMLSIDPRYLVKPGQKEQKRTITRASLHEMMQMPENNLMGYGFLISKIDENMDKLQALTEPEMEMVEQKKNENTERYYQTFFKDGRKGPMIIQPGLLDPNPEMEFLNNYRRQTMPNPYTFGYSRVNNFRYSVPYIEEYTMEEKLSGKVAFAYTEAQAHLYKDRVKPKPEPKGYRIEDLTEEVFDKIVKFYKYEIGELPDGTKYLTKVYDVKEQREWTKEEVDARNKYINDCKEQMKKNREDIEIIKQINEDDAYRIGDLAAKYNEELSTFYLWYHMNADRNVFDALRKMMLNWLNECMLNDALHEYKYRMYNKQGTIVILPAEYNEYMTKMVMPQLLLREGDRVRVYVEREKAYGKLDEDEILKRGMKQYEAIDGLESKDPGKALQNIISLRDFRCCPSDKESRIYKYINNILKALPEMKQKQFNQYLVYKKMYIHNYIAKFHDNADSQYDIWWNSYNVANGIIPVPNYRGFEGWGYVPASRKSKEFDAVAEYWNKVWDDNKKRELNRPTYEQTMQQWNEFTDHMFEKARNMEDYNKAVVHMFNKFGEIEVARSNAKYDMFGRERKANASNVRLNEGFTNGKYTQCSKADEFGRSEEEFVDRLWNPITLKMLAW